MFQILLQKLFWLRKKMPVFERYGEYQSLQWESVESYDERLKIKISNILKYSIKNVPYYKKYADIIDEVDIDNDVYSALKKLPILEKDHITSNLEALKVEIGRNTMINTTGGSTGKPVIFYQDSIFKTDSFATTLLFYEWAMRKPGTKLVKLWGAERDLVTGAYGLKQKLIDYINNRVTLNAFKLSPKRMDEYVNTMNDFNANCLEGYAESLYEFAKYIDKNKLALNSPASIVSSAGTLYPDMREKIEKVFGAPVFDRYGSREAGNMAAECELHKGLHIFGETTYVEIVDKNGDLVDEGVEGEILVTNLTNYTMPLIRYKIGDRAIKGDKICKCGRPYPLIAKIVGRSGATIYTVEGGVVSPEFFIHLIGVMLNDGSIGMFQVIQEKLEYIIVKLVAADGTSLADWTNGPEMIELIKNVMGEKCVVDICVVKGIEPTSTGKHLYTISNVVEP